MFNSLVDVPKKKIELPVAEETQMGITLDACLIKKFLLVYIQD